MSIVEIKSNALKMEVQDIVVRSYGIKKTKNQNQNQNTINHQPSLIPWCIQTKAPVRIQKFNIYEEE